MAVGCGAALEDGKDHFDGDDEKDGHHGYEAGHLGVAVVPEGGEAGVGEGGKGGWEELGMLAEKCEGGRAYVDESCGYENTGTEAGRLGGSRLGRGSSLTH